MSLLRNLISHAHKPPQSVSQKLPLIPYSDDLVTKLVYTQDDIPDRRRIDKEFVHVSSLLEFCARRQIIAMKDDIDLVYQPRGRDRVLWAMGKAAEHHIRTQIMKALDYTGCLGHWTCPCGATSYLGFFDPTVLCPRCGEKPKTYGEFPSIDENYHIIGHPDFLFLYDQQLIVLETKSMNKTDFTQLEEALPDHVFQAGSYHRIWGKQSHITMHPRIIICYVMKDYDFRIAPYKEFHIDPMEEKWQSILNIAWQNAATVRDARRKNIIPPRLRACNIPTTTTAKKCLACTGCFSRS